MTNTWASHHILQGVSVYVRAFPNKGAMTKWNQSKKGYSETPITAKNGDKKPGIPAQAGGCQVIGLWREDKELV